MDICACCSTANSVSELEPWFAPWATLLTTCRFDLLVKLNLYECARLLCRRVSWKDGIGLRVSVLPTASCVAHANNCQSPC